MPGQCAIAADGRRGRPRIGCRRDDDATVAARRPLMVYVQTGDQREFLARQVAIVRRWLFDSALPLWSVRGLDLDGFGFVEQLALDGRPSDPGFKRTRVQARQIYVFSHAHRLGWNGPAGEAASRGLDFLLAQAWLPEGGWARRLGRRGGILDPTYDLYDQAFVLFALGWHYRAFQDERSLHWARRTLDSVRDRLARPDGRGFWAILPAGGECLQNPHMHLLEAMLTLAEATGEAMFFEQARKIVALFSASLFEPASETLGEYFDAAWQRQPGPRGLVVEPGHHFEWIWLLRHYRRLGGEDLAATAGALHRFACQHGVAPATGLVFDAIDAGGRVLDARHRCWPQTEALKAHLAMAEWRGRADLGAITGVLGNLLDRYLAHQPAGTWIDQF